MTFLRLLLVLQGLADVVGMSWLATRGLTYETITNWANGSTTSNVGAGLVSCKLLYSCAQERCSLQKLINKFIFILQLVLEYGILGPKLSILSNILVKLSLFVMELVFDVLFLVEATVREATGLRHRQFVFQHPFIAASRTNSFPVESYWGAWILQKSPRWTSSFGWDRLT